MVVFEEEKSIEDKLINHLTQSGSWVHAKHLKTEEHLWDNFKHILEQNNMAELDGQMLTNAEMSQIKDKLSFNSPYEAALFYEGENGTSTLDITRDDPSRGVVHLTVLRRKDIGKGTSVYQIVNQYEAKGQNRNRTFDVSLLINGIPFIHIELKNRNESPIDAFEQIKKYKKERLFTGIYSSVQMFVISNAERTFYFPNMIESQMDRYHKDSLTSWVDTQNNKVHHYLDFVSQVLTIPFAHKMVMQYVVPNSMDNSIILLRPYQIHAIESIIDASCQSKSGYVWHTTGSGKTLTSFHVAKNLLDIPSIDSTIFLIDRNDLDNQTSKAFDSYSQHSTTDVDRSENVKELKKQLLSNKRRIIITTVQKMNNLMHKYITNPDKYKNEIQQIKEKRFAFVVDEAHRTISAAKQKEILPFFRDSLWYGFTGTPIFEENSKKEVGDLATTTGEQYGEELHRYTVKEGIADKSVLGFNVEYKDSLSDDTIDDILENVDAQRNSSTKFDLASMSRMDKEDKVPAGYYEQEEHLEFVVDRIINKSMSKFGLKNKGIGETYSAILTTSSIELAQRYFDLFTRVKNGEHDTIKISDKVLQKLPDFPKVGLTYSFTETEATSFTNQTKLQNAIALYNKEFDTNYGIDTIGAYNNDLNDRLARKGSRYNNRKEQLDIVIVVDRLLTGFDAPCLNVLFMDRTPMTEAGLIQAFSRTNRVILDDPNKRAGQIVVLQRPNLWQEKVTNAIRLYSNGGEGSVLKPSYNQKKKEYDESYREFIQLAPEPNWDDSHSETEDRSYVALFRKYYSLFIEIQTYSDYDENHDKSRIPNDKLEQYIGIYNYLKDKYSKEKKSYDLIDVDFEPMSFATDVIDYQFIVRLITQSLSYSNQDKDESVWLKLEAEIKENIQSLQKHQPLLANALEYVWVYLKNNTPKDSVLTVDDVYDALYKHTNELIGKKLSDFCDEWCINQESLSNMFDMYDSVNEDKMITSEYFYLNGERKISFNQYLARCETQGVAPCCNTAIRYGKAVKTAYIDLFRNELDQLRVM